MYIAVLLGIPPQTGDNPNAFQLGTNVLWKLLGHRKKQTPETGTNRDDPQSILKARLQASHAVGFYVWDILKVQTCGNRGPICAVQGLGQGGFDSKGAAQGGFHGNGTGLCLAVVVTPLCLSKLT